MMRRSTLLTLLTALLAFAAASFPPREQAEIYRSSVTAAEQLTEAVHALASPRHGAKE